MPWQQKYCNIFKFAVKVLLRVLNLTHFIVTKEKSKKILDWSRNMLYLNLLPLYSWYYLLHAMATTILQYSYKFNKQIFPLFWMHAKSSACSTSNISPSLLTVGWGAYLTATNMQQAYLIRNYGTPQQTDLSKRNVCWGGQKATYPHC